MPSGINIEMRYEVLIETYLSPNLVSALASLQVNDFSHFACWELNQK